MSFWQSNSVERDAQAQAAAIAKSQAVIEFAMDGTIITANQNFLEAIGYWLEEIQGKHHSMFVEPAMRDGAANIVRSGPLNRGRVSGRGIQADRQGRPGNLAPGLLQSDGRRSGKPCKVIKFATDITAQKIRSMEDAGKIAAIGRAQAVIEFNLDGTIITANENFLKTVGYSLPEIQGKHHSMFVEPAVRDGAAYREFWASLSRGQYQAAEYKRIGKGGKEIWILATYNPILDEHGKAFKVVKFATDVSEQKLNNRRHGRADRRDRQVAGGDRVQHGRNDPDRERKFPRRGGLFAGRNPGQASQHVRRTRRARGRRIP